MCQTSVLSKKKKWLIALSIGVFIIIVAVVWGAILSRNGESDMMSTSNTIRPPISDTPNRAAANNEDMNLISNSPQTSSNTISSPDASTTALLTVDEAQALLEAWLADHQLEEVYVDYYGEYGDSHVFIFNFFIGDDHYHPWVLINKETGEMLCSPTTAFFDIPDIEPGLLDDWFDMIFSAANNNAQGRIFYQGIPVIDYLNGTVDGIRTVLEVSDEDGVQNYQEVYFWVKDHEIENIFSWEPDKFSVNGTTLDKDRDGIVAVLGNPISERWDEGEGTDEYVMFYDFPEYRVIISMWDPSETVNRIYMDTLGN